MKLIPKLVPALAKDIVAALVQHKDVEITPELIPEAQLDVEAIFNEYLELDKEVSDYAKEIISVRDWGNSQFAEAKRIAANRRQLPTGDEAIDYVINQILESLLMSPHIEEVFAEDHVMRKRIVDILRKYLKIPEEVESEVRHRLKHLADQEGSQEWEIAYRRTLEEIKRAKGLL